MKNEIELVQLPIIKHQIQEICVIMAIKKENSSDLAIDYVKVKYRVLNVKHLQSLQNKIDEI